MPKDLRDDRVVFACLPGQDQPDRLPLLVLLIPEAAWDYMKDGLGHSFDMSKLGLPMKLMIGRTATHATGLEELAEANRKRGGARLVDGRHIDMAIKDDNGRKQ